MYTSGLINLCSKNSFSSSTSVDEVKAYLLDVVNTFCTATGLVLIPSLTKDLTYGVAYYIGRTSEDAYPLLCIANPGESSSYFYRGFCVSCVNSALYPIHSGTSFSWSAGSDTHTYYDNLYSTNYDYSMKYLVKDDGTIVFGIGTSTTSITYNRLISTISNDDETCSVSLALHNDAVYFSYCPEMGVTGTASSNYSISSLASKDSLCYSLPLEKDALLQNYLCNGWRVDNTLKFTNRASFASDSILTINSKKYIVVYFGGTYLSLLLLIE